MTFQKRPQVFIFLSIESFNRWQQNVCNFFPFFYDKNAFINPKRVRVYSFSFLFFEGKGRGKWRNKGKERNKEKKGKKPFNHLYCCPMTFLSFFFFKKIFTTLDNLSKKDPIKRNMKILSMLLNTHHSIGLLPPQSLMFDFPSRFILMSVSYACVRGD